MAKLILAALFMLFVALFTSGDFIAEGTVRGGILPANPGRVALATQGRLISWGAHQYRPGKVYWRVAVNS